MSYSHAIHQRFLCLALQPAAASARCWEPRETLRSIRHILRLLALLHIARRASSFQTLFTVALHGVLQLHTTLQTQRMSGQLVSMQMQQTLVLKVFGPNLSRKILLAHMLHLSTTWIFSTAMIVRSVLMRLTLASIPLDHMQTFLSTSSRPLRITLLGTTHSHIPLRLSDWKSLRSQVTQISQRFVVQIMQLLLLSRFNLLSTILLSTILAL